MSDRQLINRARELAARVRTGVLPAATTDRVSEETLRALADAGLDRLDHDLTTSLQVLTTLARGCPRTAWHVGLDDAVGLGGFDGLQRARIAAVMLGAALAALDDYEALVRARITDGAPAAAGDQETDYRRWLGMAIGRIETAQCILDEAAIGADDPTKVWMLSREVTRLAYDTVQELIVHRARSMQDGDRLASTVTTMVMLWGNQSGALDDQVSRRIACERLGLAMEPN